MKLDKKLVCELRHLPRVPEVIFSTAESVFGIIQYLDFKLPAFSQLKPLFSSWSLANVTTYVVCDEAVAVQIDEGKKAFLSLKVCVLRQRTDLVFPRLQEDNSSLPSQSNLVYLRVRHWVYLYTEQLQNISFHSYQTQIFTTGWIQGLLRSVVLLKCNRTGAIS